MALRNHTPTMPLNAGREADADGISVGQMLATLWRRGWVFLATILCVTGIGYEVLRSLTPTYTSTAIIVLAAQQDSVVDLQQPYLHVAASDAVVRSEADALQSRTLVNRVIDRETLLEDPEFNPYKRPYRPNLPTQLGIPGLLPKSLGDGLRSKPLDPLQLSPDQLKYTVATQVLKAYQVTTDPKTYSVDVAFTSVNAVKASRIANAFVEEYMRAQIDERITAANNAATWLNPRLEELRRKVEETGRAVTEFKEANHIVDLASSPTQQNTLAVQEIQNLALGLSQARAQRAQFEAAQKEVERLKDDPEQALSAPAVAAVPLVENVRVQEVTAAAQLASLRGTYGERHPLVVSAQNSLNVLRTRLREEATRAVSQLRVQMRQAQANEGELQSRMDELTRVRSGESRALPRLQQLESEQNAAKSVYDSFVQGLARAFAQDGVPTPKGRVIQRADTVDWPTYPNIPVSLAVIFSAGVMIAIGLVYVLEARDKSFHDADRLEDALGLPVLGVTLLSQSRSFMGVGKSVPVSGRIVAEPTSPGSESLRLVRTAIAYSRPEKPKVIMVTSAVPGEGKTTFSLMLARQSALSGKRVLAIEAEMRRPTFARELSHLSPKGLAEYLSGNATLEEVVGVDESTGVHFIPVRDRSRISSELLASERMAALLRHARANYDFVVIDTPPATIVADALQLGDSIDGAIVVVKWGSTPQHLVLDAVKKLRAANVPLVGTVLTQVDVRRHRFYGGGVLPYHYAKTYYTG